MPDMNFAPKSDQTAPNGIDNPSTEDSQEIGNPPKEAWMIDDEDDKKPRPSVRTPMDLGMEPTKP